MSRYVVTVRSAEATDPHAVIGYDCPMRTYFLQAFDEDRRAAPGLWLGTRFDEFPRLGALIAAASARGVMLADLADEDITAMAREAAVPSRPSLAAHHNWCVC
ncbi:hypothetical protein GGQ88_003832 [Novosphingobium hassiacum]|uniref:Uncharacterized protein n=1 Tax=Novosphingobium hassiacum TaxID=173676 RepID=A0A7W6EXQ8_9SPHN|nr:hypothetical protein [Novosphingobium hassiacum]MBB3862531.1 hypothetical protein [Novosphingobium hassiacum]